MPDSTLAKLIAAKGAADAALRDAENALLDELALAKADYRENPDDPELRNVHRQAVADVQALRAVQREGREGVGVAGDAFLAPPTPDEEA